MVIRRRLRLSIPSGSTNRARNSSEFLALFVKSIALRAIDSKYSITPPLSSPNRRGGNLGIDATALKRQNFGLSFFCFKEDLFVSEFREFKEFKECRDCFSSLVRLVIFLVEVIGRIGFSLNSLNSLNSLTSLISLISIARVKIIFTV